MNVLISINPQYVDKIIKGEKKYEFRRNKIKFDNGDRFYIYSTSPVKKIVAAMTVDKILEGPPEQIWDMCGQYSGGEKDGFLEYFSDKSIAYALSIKDVNVLDKPIDPYKIISNFRPPQSFYYLRDDRLTNIDTEK